MAGLSRPARETRGKRMTQLLDDELEADEQFWNQDAFQEAEEDQEYKEEKELEDVFDSDFDEEEPESNGEEDEEKERRPTAKRKLPPGSKKKVKRLKIKLTDVTRNASALEDLAAAAAGGRTPSPPKSEKRPRRPSELEQLGGAWEGDTGTPQERRKSTRTAVVVKAIEREAVKAAQTPKVVKKKRAGDEERRWTQEEMLLEAAQTEVLNRQSLEIMLAKEEEVKRRAIIEKETYKGPQIRFHSKNGINTLEFTCVDEVPEILNSKAPPYPERSFCVITGQPAKYRDPRTGLPYSTKEAFRAIRERWGDGEAMDHAPGSVPRRRMKSVREKSESTVGPGGRWRAGRATDFRMGYG